MPMSVEATARLLAIQKKVLEGTDTLDDLQEGIGLLRQDRVAASVAGTTSRTKRIAETKVVDPAAVLADLKSIGLNLSSGPIQGA